MEKILSYDEAKKNIRRKIFHLYKKVSKTNHYYGSLKAVFDENKDLGVSKYKLDRWNFEKPFENEVCVLIKGIMKTTGDVFSASKLKKDTLRNSSDILDINKKNKFRK